MYRRRCRPTPCQVCGHVYLVVHQRCSAVDLSGQAQLICLSSVYSALKLVALHWQNVHLQKHVSVIPSAHSCRDSHCLQHAGELLQVLHEPCLQSYKHLRILKTSIQQQAHVATKIISDGHRIHTCCFVNTYIPH